MAKANHPEQSTPTLREIVDRFVVQFELAASERHRERADRAYETFRESLDHFFFSPPVLDDDEPIGYLMPMGCVTQMNRAGFVTAGDVRKASRQRLYEIRELGARRVSEICMVLARFGVSPGRNVD